MPAPGVVRDLPERIKFLFAQRPEDVLVSSRDFMALQQSGKVVSIPDRQLDVLDEPAVEDLLNLRGAKALCVGACWPGGS